MRESVIGIVDCQGVSDLRTEDARNARFLQRRAAYDSTRQTRCFWAVLTTETRLTIQQQLACGNRHDATRTLASHAIDGGLVVPN